ncbi:MAG: spondin domain-containing protein, partial [Verrucomicrobiota bacterium]
MKKSLQPTVLALLAGAATSQAVLIEVRVETTGPVGLAPGLAAFSDGSFDVFDPGSMASSALETLAETGAPSDFAPPAGGAVFGPGIGPGSPPIFAPGASATAIFDVPANFSSFNFASMLLPSNDWFIGNGTGLDISSLLGGSVTSLSFDFSTVWDAGTELEDFDFSPGNG